MFFAESSVFFSSHKLCDLSLLINFLLNNYHLFAENLYTNNFLNYVCKIYIHIPLCFSPNKKLQNVPRILIYTTIIFLHYFALRRFLYDCKINCPLFFEKESFPKNMFLSVWYFFEKIKHVEINSGVVLSLYFLKVLKMGRERVF